MLRRWMRAARRLLVRLGLLRPGKIMYIGGSDTLPPPLNREEEAALLARLDGGEAPDSHRAEPAAGGVHRPPV